MNGACRRNRTRWQAGRAGERDAPASGACRHSRTRAAAGRAAGQDAPVNATRGQAKRVGTAERVGRQGAQVNAPRGQAERAGIAERARRRGAIFSKNKKREAQSPSLGDGPAFVASRFRFRRRPSGRISGASAPAVPLLYPTQAPFVNPLRSGSKNTARCAAYETACPIRAGRGAGEIGCAGSGRGPVYRTGARSGIAENLRAVEVQAVKRRILERNTTDKKARIFMRA